MPERVFTHEYVVLSGDTLEELAEKLNAVQAENHAVATLRITKPMKTQKDDPQPWQTLIKVTQEVTE